MQELLGRLRDIDSSAANAVGIIQYFDSLVEGRAGVHAFLRAAAALSGAVSGIDVPAFRISARVNPDGRPLEANPDQASCEGSTRALSETIGGRVWIERCGEQGASDQIILERLSAGVQVALGRTRHHQSHDPARVDVLLDAESSFPDRAEAAQRLGLDLRATARVTAILSSRSEDDPAALPPWPRSTRIGRVVAVVLQPHHNSPDLGPEFRSGTGPSLPVGELHQSWRGALTALRFTSAAAAGLYAPAQHLSFDELGVMQRLACSWDQDQTPDPDVVALRVLEQEAPNSILILEALAATESYRQAATLLHRHHSSLQARVPRLEESLGYRFDPPGKLRLAAALAMQRLAASGALP
ncbi:hypothetical protein [Amycolatopsis pithecellobii]|uniref:PucR C-terminal helix-turn-helix domain-containing protein n=1 Tax=Amycolatopsis pithecellobii TaxID=664692 RepID=A0A6N7Z1J1_9PSEU|nr:hypothetical protein [Amycolatopsis pithecellobii]MTD53731.1 hypothetical protein [Amycolatopsis pithecellobii]